MRAFCVLSDTKDERDIVAAVGHNRSLDALCCQKKEQKGTVRHCVFCEMDRLQTTEKRHTNKVLLKHSCRGKREGGTCLCEHWLAVQAQLFAQKSELFGAGSFVTVGTQLANIREARFSWEKHLRSMNTGCCRTRACIPLREELGVCRGLVDSSCFSGACSWNSLGETHVKEAQERRRSIHAARGGGPRQNKRGRRASRVGHFVCVEISAPRGRLDDY